MTIAVNARFLSQQVTGTQRFAINISREIKKMRPETIFLSPPAILHQELARELDAVIIGKQNYRRYSRLRLPATLLWEQIDLPRWLKKNKPLPLLNLANLAPLSYPDNWITIHDLAFRLFPRYFSRKFRLFYNFAVPRLARRAKTIFTVSNFSKQSIKTTLQIATEKIIVAYNAVDEQYWHSFPARPSPYPWPYILTVGSLEPRKNISRLVAAFSRLDTGSLHLIVVGRENTAVFSKAPEKCREKIVFTGQLDDAGLANLYAHAVCLCYPSLHEGFGLPPLEAQSLGCPVIVSNSSSLPEIFQDSAIYCDPYSVDSIMEKLQKLAANEVLREKLAAAGHRNVKRFSWKKSAGIILDSLEEECYSSTSV